MSTLLTAYAWRHRTTKGSRWFAIFMGAITVYVLAYSMELSSLDLPTMLLWSRIGYLGIFVFPTAFLLFVFQYTGLERWITWRNILLLFFIPTLLLIAKFTDGALHLVYSSTWVDTSGVIPLLGFTRGPVYAFALYACLPVGVGIFLLWRKRPYIPPLYRSQVTLLVVTVIPPVLVFLVYMAGLQPIPGMKYIDLNAFTYILWGFGLGWAVFRYQLFELAPVAREALIERLSDGVFVLDNQSRLVDANPEALKILGWTQAPIGQDVRKVFSAWNQLSDLCQTSGWESPVRAEIQHLNGRGSETFDLSITPLREAGGIAIGRLILIHDITPRKQLEEKLRELSLVDDLTGLSNRRGFNMLASQFLFMAKRMDLKAAVIFADLDSLKRINDSFGHAEGDQALVDTANLLRNTSRSSDIVARLGGDEFVALAIETGDNSAEAILARVNAQLAALNEKRGARPPISISFGVAHYHPDQPRGLEDLLEEADRAMYEQKQAKKQAGEKMKENNTLSKI